MCNSWVSCIIGIVAICAPIGCRATGPPDVTAEATNSDPDMSEVRAVWRTIRTTLPAKPLDQYQTIDWWWNELLVKNNDAFWAACAPPNVEKTLVFLTRQFGKHGADADLRLLLAEPSVMLAQHYPEPGAATLGDPSPHSDWRARVIDAQTIVARVQVDMFLRDPKLLHRYYQALMWSRQCFYPGLALGYKLTSLEKHFDDEIDGDYWWHARDFVIVAHATGRDDLLKGAAPNDLYSRFVEWRRWVDKNYEYLVPDHEKLIWVVGKYPNGVFGPEPLKPPKLPFPDWKSGIRPPDWRLIDQLKW